MLRGLSALPRLGTVDRPPRGGFSLEAYTGSRIGEAAARRKGNDEAAGRLLARHGTPLTAPEGGRPVALECIRWHREPALGGVFRQPPRPLS